MIIIMITWSILTIIRHSIPLFKVRDEHHVAPDEWSWIIGAADPAADPATAVPLPPVFANGVRVWFCCKLQTDRMGSFLWFIVVYCVCFVMFIYCCFWLFFVTFFLFSFIFTPISFIFSLFLLHFCHFLHHFYIILYHFSFFSSLLPPFSSPFHRLNIRSTPGNTNCASPAASPSSNTALSANQERPMLPLNFAFYFKRILFRRQRHFRRRLGCHATVSIYTGHRYEGRRS